MPDKRDVGEMAQPATNAMGPSHSTYLLSEAVHDVSKQLHGFSDASESAYAGAIYLKTIDSMNKTRMALVMTKTKVVLVKRLTIPHLELSGTLITAKLLHYCRKILDVP